MLIMLKAKNNTLMNLALTSKIDINGTENVIREYIDKTVIRCTKCQKFGHAKSKCKAEHQVCVRCASTGCKIRDCQKPTRTCENCKGNHASSHKACPKLESLQREKFQKTIRQINHLIYTKYQIM